LVPITPTIPVLVAFAAAMAPGSMTPTTGTLLYSLRAGMLTEEAVLQAATRSLMPFPSRNAASSRENLMTVSGDLDP